MNPKVIKWTSEQITALRFRFESLSEITSFSSDPKLCAQIASYGVFREIGTVNDELAKFIFDTQSEKPVPLNS